jgi:hypothetical protein
LKIVSMDEKTGGQAAARPETPQNPQESLAPLEDRIKELGAKSNQVLIALSFAILAAATLSKDGEATREKLHFALLWWTGGRFSLRSLASSHSKNSATGTTAGMKSFASLRSCFFGAPQFASSSVP